MKKLKTITLPGLVKELGPDVIAKALDLNACTPYLWAHGARPSWKNVEKLMALANEHGFRLEVIR